MSYPSGSALAVNTFNLICIHFEKVPQYINKQIESNKTDKNHKLTCLTALSISQSWKIINGDFPPSSKDTFLMLLIAALFKNNENKLF